MSSWLELRPGAQSQQIRAQIDIWLERSDQIGNNHIRLHFSNSTLPRRHGVGLVTSRMLKLLVVLCAAAAQAALVAAPQPRAIAAVSAASCSAAMPLAPMRCTHHFCHLSSVI
eukprot:6193559-Pleurochrysis_carterae.AAC.1